MKYIALALFIPFLASAQVDTNALARMFAAKQLEASLHFQKGKITLKNDLATLSLPDTFRYLPPEDAETVLVKMWGNPPSGKTLGLIVPAGVSFLNPACWAVVITYLDEGYVKDADANKIDYTKLLAEMKQGVSEESKERVKQGYHSIELVGWAAPPYYDKDTHKMYWAKEIRFGDSKENTLNYGIRVLGRRGVLVLNAVASMDQFAEIQKQTPDVVKMVEFNAGNRYADFNGSSDKVAAYGLAALIAGGIAAKAGFFKVLIVGLLAAKKFVIIGVIAAASFIKKMFKPKSGPLPPTSGV